MSSFTSVLHCLDEDFLEAIAVSAEQIEAASKGSKRGLDVADLGLSRVFRCLATSSSSRGT